MARLPSNLSHSKENPLSCRTGVFHARMICHKITWSTIYNILHTKAHISNNAKHLYHAHVCFSPIPHPRFSPPRCWLLFYISIYSEPHSPYPYPLWLLLEHLYAHSRGCLYICAAMLRLFYSGFRISDAHNTYPSLWWFVSVFGATICHTYYILRARYVFTRAKIFIIML